MVQFFISIDPGETIGRGNRTHLHDSLYAFTVRQMQSSQNIPMPKPRKLTRSQIKEGMKAVPIERILLGAAGGGKRALTAKQTAFAEAIAMGETTAGAYRSAYKSKGKPKTVHAEGAKLKNDPRIATEIEARKVEKMAEKSQTPAEIREATIRALVQHAQDESFPPAQRVKCLELLGKITEVALFTERREIVRVTDAGEAKARLLEALRAAITRNASTVDATNALTLIAEIRRGDAITIDADTDPPPATPLNSGQMEGGDCHSIPHTESALQTDGGTPSEISTGASEAVDVEPTPYENGSPSEEVEK